MGLCLPKRRSRSACAALAFALRHAAPRLRPSPRGPLFRLGTCHCWRAIYNHVQRHGGERKRSVSCAQPTFPPSFACSLTLRRPSIMCISMAVRRTAAGPPASPMAGTFSRSPSPRARCYSPPTPFLPARYVRHNQMLKRRFLTLLCADLGPRERRLLRRVL